MSNNILKCLSLEFAVLLHSWLCCILSGIFTVLSVSFSQESCWLSWNLTIIDVVQRHSTTADKVFCSRYLNRRINLPLLFCPLLMFRTEEGLLLCAFVLAIWLISVFSSMLRKSPDEKSDSAPEERETWHYAEIFRTRGQHKPPLTKFTCVQQHSQMFVPWIRGLTGFLPSWLCYALSNIRSYQVWSFPQHLVGYVELWPS